MNAAVIFDVDGVLLELTSAEEDAFFAPFAQRYGLENLSRDWNSYAIRNDENIIAEIPCGAMVCQSTSTPKSVADYLDVLKTAPEKWRH
jgi:FMN phosphatase YigB (HAD superfamily)